MTNTIEIIIYDKREKASTNLYVEPLGENKFRMVDNDLLNCDLTLGTEFETRINKEGKHEIIRITKPSEFVTRRFLLSSNNTESEYRVLGDEITRHGGFWQVDFGGLVTVNIPQDSRFDLDERVRELGLALAEIVEEE